MSKEVSEWSRTASQNAFTPADGGAAEGWTGKDVNNAARERMRAFAEYYAAPEYVESLTAEAPYGVKPLVRDDATNFHVADGNDYTAVFTVGRRIRVYSTSGDVDLWVKSVALNGGSGDTEVEVQGGTLPAPLDAVGFHCSRTLAPLVFSGVGTQAARDAAFPDPPDLLLWLDTDTQYVEVSLGGVWPIRLPISDESTLTRIAHKDASGTRLSTLELDDDGELYHEDGTSGRKILTPGKVDAATISGLGFSENLFIEKTTGQQIVASPSGQEDAITDMTNIDLNGDGSKSFLIDVYVGIQHISTDFAVDALMSLRLGPLGTIADPVVFSTGENQISQDGGFVGCQHVLTPASGDKLTVTVTLERNETRTYDIATDVLPLDTFGRGSRLVKTIFSP